MPHEGMIYALEIIANLPTSIYPRVEEGREDAYRAIEKEFEKMYEYKPEVGLKQPDGTLKFVTI